MSTSTIQPPSAAWWGPRKLAPGQHARWSVGPLDLWLAHGAQEWQMVLQRPREPADATLAVEIPCRDPFPADGSDRVRFAGAAASARPALRVALADRPMVSRPQNPFYVPARGQVTLYLSSPVWVQLLIGAAQVQEFPVYVPSDTWFGTNTVDGELCYATRSQARLDLADVPRRPHRVVTPLTIVNKAPDALFLERVNLPVPRLPVYADEQHRLWTPAVRMEREEDRDLATMKIDPAPPGLARGARRVAEPRQAGARHVMIRAFSALFQ